MFLSIAGIGVLQEQAWLSNTFDRQSGTWVSDYDVFQKKGVAHVLLLYNQKVAPKHQTNFTHLISNIHFKKLFIEFFDYRLPVENIFIQR